MVRNIQVELIGFSRSQFSITSGYHVTHESLVISKVSWVFDEAPVSIVSQNFRLLGKTGLWYLNGSGIS